jgi:hypothetical protein
MPRQNESFGELLLKLPWWVSAALGSVAFAGVCWGLPIRAGNDNSRQMLAKDNMGWSGWEEFRNLIPNDKTN